MRRDLLALQDPLGHHGLRAPPLLRADGLIFTLMLGLHSSGDTNALIATIVYSKN